MSIKITILGDHATIESPFPMSFMSIISRLSGRKIWKQAKSVRFEASPDNINRIKNSNHDINWIDDYKELEEIEKLSNMITQHANVEVKITEKYIPNLELFRHQ